MTWKPGDKALCIDDEGWLIPDPGFEHLTPKKGTVYLVREFTKVGGVGALSFMGWHKDHFYRACRFRKLNLVATSSMAEAKKEKLTTKGE